MLDGNRDDASYWSNYTPQAHPAEVARMGHLFSDSARVRALLDFGMRPWGPMDRDPYDQPVGLMRPWEPQAADLAGEPILVDVQTGWRFRVEEETIELDLSMSDNFMGTQILLSRAAHRDSGFTFVGERRPACHRMGGGGSFPLTQPVQLKASDEATLRAHVGRLEELFCGHFRVPRLWFRGQRQEYRLNRSPEITQQLYATDHQASMHPSLGRFAAGHPEKMNHGFAWAGPNHLWKKPFLTWLMRVNKHWFAHEPRCLDVLTGILRDDDDMRFANLLNQIQMSPLEVGDPPFLNWPDEADDLRQWFFAFMKRFEFGVTLQQYGYVTSLLDVTTDLDVALYFSQAAMIDGRMQLRAPQPGRVIYVMAEPPGSAFFRHGDDLFWGDEGWERTLPPRLHRQCAGFAAGSTNRSQNAYEGMVVAKIWLGDKLPETRLDDAALFPPSRDDLLYATLQESRPELEGLY